MKPSSVLSLCVAIGLCACAKGSGSKSGQALSSWGQSLFKSEDTFVSQLKRKQDANLLRLAQQRASEEALEERSSSSGGVPSGMYRSSEPPLPEPDLSLPVSDVPRSVPSATPER
jgi:hypothetical protein